MQRTVTTMKTAYHYINNNKIDELILKYADEKLGFRDTVNFELMLQESSEQLEIARINRLIRKELRSLPEIKASAGFQERLMNRINRKS